MDLREQSSRNSSNFTDGSIPPTEETVVVKTQLIEAGDVQTSLVQKSRGRGTVSSIKTHLMKTRRSNSNPNQSSKKVKWNLGDEIAKVIEKGVELGIEFMSKNLRKGEEDGNKILIESLLPPSLPLEEYFHQ